jgi:hypothetical protein
MAVHYYTSLMMATLVGLKHVASVPLGTPNVYVPPFSITLLYQPDDGPFSWVKHVAFVKTF